MLVTEAKITNDNGDGTYSINIPLYSASTYNNVPVCISTGIVPILKKGNIVYISFRDNDYGSPVIIGSKPVSGTTVESNATLNSLIVSGNSTLSKDTKIGEVPYTTLEYLIGCTSNIAAQFTALNSAVDSIDTQNLSGVKSIILSTDMYGSESDMKKAAKTAEEGQLFFMIGEE